MDPFAHARLFQRIVELGSIRAAAREAGLEPSSVSRQMNRLEARLGSKLLERAQNKTRLTEAGDQYYQHMRVLLPQLEAVENMIAGEAETPKGLLKVNAAIDFGRQYVADWLLAFRAQNPQVDVELSLSSQHIDLVRDGIDVAVRVGRLRDSSLKARRIAMVPRVLVASPGYLSEHGVPSKPAELAAHDHVFFSPANRHTPLELIDGNGKTHAIERRGGVTTTPYRRSSKLSRRVAGYTRVLAGRFNPRLTEVTSWSSYPTIGNRQWL